MYGLKAVPFNNNDFFRSLLSRAERKNDVQIRTDKTDTQGERVGVKDQRQLHSGHFRLNCISSSVTGFRHEPPRPREL